MFGYFSYEQSYIIKIKLINLSFDYMYSIFSILYNKKWYAWVFFVVNKLPKPFKIKTI